MSEYAVKMENLCQQHPQNTPPLLFSKLASVATTQAVDFDVYGDGKFLKAFEKEVEDNLLRPEPDEYTEFDPTRHSDVKGTLAPRFIKYGIHSIYRI